jgi:uncharacterized protein
MRRTLMMKIGICAAALITTGYDWAAELAAGKYTEWTTDKDIFVPMRDGIHLDTDVWLPKGAAGKLPTVFVRTPYDKDKGEVMVGAKWLELYVKHGYAVVVQNERGRYFSEGYYKHYLESGSADGHDTIDWIVKQPWSNGKVGTMGCSSSGDTNWATAVANHPAHAAMIAGAAGTSVGNVPGNTTQGGHLRGGVPWIGFWAGYYVLHGTGERLLLPLNSTQEQRIRLRTSYSLMAQQDPGGWEGYVGPTISHLPSKDIVRALGGAYSVFDDNFTWSPTDERWKEVNFVRDDEKPRVPALLVDTWYDPAVGETTRLFKYLEDLGTQNQHLIVGAGPHCTFMLQPLLDPTTLARGLAHSEAPVKASDLAKLADLDLAHLKFDDVEMGDARYGGDDRGYEKLFLSWFNHWLKGEETHVTEMPRVQLFVMGKGWISSDSWPLSDTHYTKYYLSSDRTLPRRKRAGLLTTSAPREDERDSYLYDPGSPTPSLTVDYATAALDQRPVEARADVLVYSTSALEKPVTIAGPIEAVLYVSSSAKDTDFMVKLVDVYPDGKAINLSDDAFRVRYREGFDKKVLMQASHVYKIRLTNMVTAIRFPAGHRIRLDVSSSNFPKFERNLNTGGNNYDETKWVVAENTVLHGDTYPSHIVLPVLPDD